MGSAQSTTPSPPPKPTPKSSVVKNYINPVFFINELKKYDNVDGINLFPKIDIDNYILDTIGENSAAEEFLMKLKGIDESSESLRTLLQKDYQSIIIEFLKAFKDVRVNLDICGENVKYINVVYAGLDSENRLSIIDITQTKPSNVREHLAHIIKPEDIDVYLNEVKQSASKSNIVVSPTFEETLRKKVETLDNSNKINQIKRELTECTSQYYLIPVGSFPLITRSGHSNLMIVNKQNKQVFYIEPQFYGTDTETLKQKSSRVFSLQKGFIVKILNLLELYGYKVVYPVTAYPQSIANDRNCLFWTFLITCLFLINPQVERPDDIAKAILKKYPLKEDLVEYIETFKNIVYIIHDSIQSLKTGGKTRRSKKNRKTLKRVKSKQLI
jgi:hypothetical protein